MFGLSIARVKGNSLAPQLPHGSIVMFRRRRGVARGDVVLVDHPDLGRIVRKVTTVGRRGNVYLKDVPRDEETNEPQSRVARELVRGVMFGKLY